jgi:predicted RecA/RadA family phage recombinase
MSNLSQYLKEGEAVDHTPVGALDAGSIVQIGSLSAYVPHDVAAGALGAVYTKGVIRGPFVGGVANVGDNVWWDATGTPYLGAANGAFTCNAAAGDWWVGTLAAAAVAASAECDIALNKRNPALPAWPDRKHFLVIDDTTLTEADHSGGVIHVKKNAGTSVTITLPAGLGGMEFIIQNDEADAGNLCRVDLDGTEIIRGANLTIANGKLADNTKLTSIRGDYLHLECNVAATAWRCVAKRGIWVTN